MQDGLKIGDLSFRDLTRFLDGDGIVLRSGCFTVRVTSPLKQVASGIRTLYADYDFTTDAEFSDCHVRIATARGLGQFRPRPTRMIVNGQEWHRTSRSVQFACVEWGINWFIFRSAHHLLVIHAATLERDGVGLIMPALPGSGKSTLTAALSHAGWRLFSDELAVIRPETGELLPLARPICLKGDSIPVIREFAPQARFGPVAFDRTERRSIAHVKPPAEAVERMEEPASPRLILFPKYSPSSPTILTPVSRANSFIQLAQSAFNYSTLRRQGFETLQGVIDQCQSYELVYSDLAEAVDCIHELVSETASVAAQVQRVD